MKTCLVQLCIGDKVIYEPNGRNIEMIIKDYQLVPNGINDPKIVCLLTAERVDGFQVQAASDKFIILANEEYKSVYIQYNTK